MVLRCHTGTCVCPLNKNLSLNENCQCLQATLGVLTELLERQDLGVHSLYAVLSVTHWPRSFKEKNSRHKLGQQLKFHLLLPH